MQAFEELSRCIELKRLVAGLDAEEKAVAAGQQELRHVEQRMMGARQPVKSEHAKHRRLGGQHRFRHRGRSGSGRGRTG